MDAAALSHEVNSRTYEVILAFGRSEPQEDPLGAFLCECGCLTYVALPLTRYADSGAWIDEHRPA